MLLLATAVALLDSVKLSTFVALYLAFQQFVVVMQFIPTHHSHTTHTVNTPSTHNTFIINSTTTSGGTKRFKINQVNTTH